MRTLAVVACILTVLLSGCGRKEESGKPRVAVSSEPLAWLLRQIAGDDVETVTLIPPGSNPETYQPSVGTMKELANASVFFTLNTPGFEKSLGNSIAGNFPDLPITDVSEGIEKIYGTHAATNESENGFDPHMLTSLRNCMMIGETMTETLSEMFPDKAASYAGAYGKLRTRLSELDSIIATKDIKGKTIVVKHPVLTYFARDYGIRQIALEKEGKEPTPLQLSAQIESIRNASPSIVVTEPSGNNALETQVSEELGIPMVEVNLSSDKWIDELSRTADEIDRN